MYNLTRQQASEILGISLRSVDRYVKSGKIRAEKNGKTVLLNEEDVKILSGETPTKQKIIINTEEIPKHTTNNINNNNKEKNIVKQKDYDKLITTFEKIYNGFKEEIKQKDIQIQNLYLELGELKEKNKNSVNILEYKKNQIVSNEEKKQLISKLEEEKEKKEKIKKELNYEKTTNKILITFLIILFIVSSIIFFLNI